MPSQLRVLSIAALATLWVAAPALALVVVGANPERSSRVPPDDPGWSRVGRLLTTSAIHVGHGWVLTAKHSSVAEVVFDGQTYPAVPDSMVWLDDPSGSKGDLMLFRLDGAPDLPPLPIRRRTPPPGTLVTLVGWGAGAAGPTVWRGTEGFRVGNGGKRWGMNVVLPGTIDVPGPNETRTRSFQIDFSQDGVPHEAQAAVGDSGGAVFSRGPKGWRLAGVMISTGLLSEQPADVSLYGNRTLVADLSVYADQIEHVLEQAARP